MFKKLLQKNRTKDKGFVLLFSILVSTLVLAVGTSIISLALKQVTLSGSGRDSQFAFYAANTGAECAFYWDLAGDINGNPVFYASSTNYTVPGNDVTCLDQVITADQNSSCDLSSRSDDPGWCYQDSGNQYYTKFRIQYDPTDLNYVPYCADVLVIKTLSPDGSVASTSVLSYGYNTCDSSNPRRIERGLEFNY